MTKSSAALSRNCLNSCGEVGPDVTARQLGYQNNAASECVLDGGITSKAASRRHTQFAGVVVISLD